VLGGALLIKRCLLVLDEPSKCNFIDTRPHRPENGGARRGSLIRRPSCVVVRCVMPLLIKPRDFLTARELLFARSVRAPLKRPVRAAVYSESVAFK
jgi:hypothetical protein